MTVDKVRYPGPGCVVEFMQGNASSVAFVLESQGGRLRLYTQNRRETALADSRLLPWSGPAFPASLSREAIDKMLEERRAVRAALAAEINLPELWELVQGEAEKASITWLAALVWPKPTIDHEAALGHALLANKTHFRLSPPDFEIFPREIVENRLAEAEIQREREKVLGVGGELFRRLWDIHCRRREGLTQSELPPDDLAQRLRAMLFDCMAERETPDTEVLWKQLNKGLPEAAHLALLLAVAWGIVPEHYNYLLDRVGYERGVAWAKDFSAECAAFRERAIEGVQKLPRLACIGAKEGKNADCAHAVFSTGAPTDPACFLSIDPASTRDRDDAICVQSMANGGFHVRVALACPGVYWPFGGAFDKAVLRRASSLYLPEGDEHMLPSAVGCELFSMDAGVERPSFVVDMHLDAEGALTSMHPSLATVKLAANLALPDVDAVLAVYDINGAMSANGAAAEGVAPQHVAEKNAAAYSFADVEALFAASEPDAKESPTPLPNNPAAAYTDFLHSAYTLAKLLQARRIASGAVITERPDPEIVLEGTGCEILVHIEDTPPSHRAHLVVGELMVLVNSSLATWAVERDIPLFFRAQDVALPREFAGVWSAPQDISRIVRALPPASLEVQPKRHAGLGLAAYTTGSSPLRRYTDLVNQGQCARYLMEGEPVFSQADLTALLPFVAARNDAVGQVQRMRPRYWKFLFFRQQGDKKWWNAVVTEENEAFATIALPWAQLLVRGKRALFDEKVFPGQRVEVRIGKVVPLLGDIHILETREG